MIGINVIMAVFIIEIQVNPIYNTCMTMAVTVDPQLSEPPIFSNNDLNAQTS